MGSKQDKSAEIISQGIDSLITQLKADGVQAGRDEAEKIMAAAKTKANEIVNQAQSKAQALMKEAHQTILREKKATEDALQLAARNMRLELRQNLLDRFRQEVNRIVRHELDNEAMIRQLILILARDTQEQIQAYQSNQVEIQLPQKVLEFDEIRKNPDMLAKDPLKELVQSVTQQMLKKGISLKISQNSKHSAGIKVSLVEEEIVLDLTEDAVSQLLIKHMQPRFRALLEGLLQ